MRSSPRRRRWQVSSTIFIAGEFKAPAHCFVKAVTLECSYGYVILAAADLQSPARTRCKAGRRYLQNGVCLLPKTDDHVRGLKMIENWRLRDGESVILETVAVDRLQEEKVIARFQADRDEAYRKFIDKCGDFDAEITRNGQRTTSPTPSLRIMTSI